jgi:hypothetical protein
MLLGIFRDLILGTMPEFSWEERTIPPNPQNNWAVGRNSKMMLPAYYGGQIPRTAMPHILT